MKRKLKRKSLFKNFPLGEKIVKGWKSKEFIYSSPFLRLQSFATNQIAFRPPPPPGKNCTGREKLLWALTFFSLAIFHLWLFSAAFILYFPLCCSIIMKNHIYMFYMLQLFCLRNFSMVFLWFYCSILNSWMVFYCILLFLSKTKGGVVGDGLHLPSIPMIGLLNNFLFGSRRHNCRMRIEHVMGMDWRQ